MEDCGKRANPKSGFGAKKLTNEELKQFIRNHAPADVVKQLKPSASRGDMCALLSLFKEGRDLKGKEISSS